MYLTLSWHVPRTMKSYITGTFQIAFICTLQNLAPFHCEMHVKNSNFLLQDNIAGFSSLKQKRSQFLSSCTMHLLVRTSHIFCCLQRHRTLQTWWGLNWNWDRKHCFHVVLEVREWMRERERETGREGEKEKELERKRERTMRNKWQPQIYHACFLLLAIFDIQSN